MKIEIQIRHIFLSLVILALAYASTMDKGGGSSSAMSSYSSHRSFFSIFTTDIAFKEVDFPSHGFAYNTGTVFLNTLAYPFMLSRNLGRYMLGWFSV